MPEKTILLVEDAPDDIELILRELRRGSIANEVVVTRDGAEGLDYLFGTGGYAGQGPADLPAVVLLDLKLPKVDGLEVLERIRANERTKSLPVVILTSSTEEDDVINGYRLGANSYVRKPVGFEEFTESVRQLKLYWLLVNEPPRELG